MTQLLGIALTALLFFHLENLIYRKFWDKDLTATISFSTSGIFEGQEGHLVEVVENKKRLPLAVLKVKFQTDRHLLFEDNRGSRTTDKYYRNDVFQVSGGEKLTRIIPFVGGRRGYYTITTMHLMAADMLMSCRHAAIQPVSTSLYVYPRLFESAEFHRSLRQVNGDILTKRHMLEDPFEFHSIREYQPTDELKSINWKATAKTGELKVNRKNYTSLKSVRLFFHLEDDEFRKKENSMEACLQIAAGICSYFLKQGFCVSCYGNGVDIITGLPVAVEASSSHSQLETILRALARVDLSKPAADFRNCFSSKLLTETNGSYTFFVSLNGCLDFMDLVKEFHIRNTDYAWFCPLAENKEPEVPGFLRNRIHFIPQQKM